MTTKRNDRAASVGRVEAFDSRRINLSRRSTAMSNKMLDAQELAVALMARHGLAGWRFRFNRARRRAGVCFYPALGRPGRIELSVHFVERNSAEEIRETILHEIAHALAGHGHHHDDFWKSICVRIGAKPERCYDAAAVDMPKGRWRAACPGCKAEHHRHKRPRSLTGYHCRSCGPKKGQLVWGEATP